MTRTQFGVVLFIIFLTSLDLSIIGPALNTVGAEWAVSERALPWGVSSYVLAYLLGMPLLARASDVLGRRVVLIAGTATFVAGSAVAAQAPGFDWLLAGRALQGLGAGGIAPVVIALIGDTMPPERQASALGISGAMMGLGFIAGPILGGVLLQVSWRLLFLINVPLGLAVIVAMARSLPDSRPPGSLRMDWPGLALLITSFGALALGISSLDLRDLIASFGSPTVWPLFAATLVLLPMFYAHERRATHPILNPALLRSRRLIVISLICFAGGIGRVSVQFVPRVVKLAFGTTDAEASLMLIPAATTFVAASFAVGVLLKRIGPLRVLASFGALFTTGLVIFATHLDHLWTFYTSTVMISIGLAGVIGPPLRYLINMETTDRDRGSAQAFMLNVELIGQLTGASLIGAFAASWGGGLRGYSIVFLALAGLALAMTLLTAALKRR